MSNETNDQPTARLEDLGLMPEADAAEDRGATPLREAEPAWLSQWGKAPQRTTPRVRWAEIIWGLAFIAIGWFALWTLAERSRRAAFSDWMTTLSGGGWAIVAALALGGLLLVLGLTAALRAATRQRA